MTQQQNVVAATVHFDIGQITLHGYSPGQRSRFVSTLQRRLTELAAGDGYGWQAPRPHRLGHLDAGVLPPGAAPEEAAERIAARLISAISGGPGERHV